ncbi:uncharacterized protein LOC107263001 isoform X1 [Cephus cinctus]|uniref:Uncharacterized protein LOC107263001 isoform X1 n=1 Tax=Cephus cinctus TaxID=211228 RepID=A0AAJ7VWU5_CEPCN|nr:uncharacterized protein LOC107263001 isoform X1 [Cephus cinctus]
MATVEDDSFQNLKSHSMHPAEKLEWVPLSLTLVEYPHVKFKKKSQFSPISNSKEWHLLIFKMTKHLPSTLYRHWAKSIIVSHK